jgi:rfaE bifunctional protein nucleotidyltransferase chain/domain
VKESQPARAVEPFSASRTIGVEITLKEYGANDIDRWVAAQRGGGKRIGYTCGAFDILHAGHIDYLQRARQFCDCLLVAVNSDRSIQAYKSALRPINPEQARMAVVAGLRCVDAVTLLDEERPLSQLLRWRPDLYIKGGDYARDKLRSADAVQAYGGQVIVIPVNIPTSTTAIIGRVLAVTAHAEPQRAAQQGRVVFLDRDGTLMRDIPFLSDPAKVELLPGVGKGLAELQRLGFRLVLVTNQQGIGLGYHSTCDMIRVNQALFRALAPFGVEVSRVFYCPHSAADHCGCRKPGTQLLEAAIRHFSAVAQDCYLIGDRASDVMAGEALGCPSVLVGGETSLEGSHTAASFMDAVAWIRSREARRC